ncbi:MAG: hypothetical protein JNG88_04660 [Phycisphaerales bacterium]|nr:hypothetical protein [Phycisphaerales bacterium]
MNRLSAFFSRPSAIFLMAAAMLLVASTAGLGQQPTTSAPSAGAPLSDAGEILKRADAATKKLKSIRYKCEHKASGALENRLPPVSGTVVMSGDKNELGLAKFRLEARTQTPGSKVPINVTALSDGREYLFVDVDTRTLHAGASVEVLGPRGNSALFGVMRELFLPEPFKDELGARKLEFKGIDKIGAEECYKIHVVYKDEGSESNWWFSRGDFLPRRVERTMDIGNKQIGVSDLILTDVAVDPKFVDDPFKLLISEEFIRSADPAP